MTIYEELKKDHQKVLGLIDQLLQAQHADNKVKENLVQQIRDELIPHARAEEAVLYNSIRDIKTAENLVSHAYREHLEAETLFRAIQVTESVNMSWVNGVKKFKEALQHHIQEEETELFPAAKKLFAEDEAVTMAEVFNKMKPMVRKQSFLGTSADMLVNMMPSRFRDAFSKFTTETPQSRAS